MWIRISVIEAYANVSKKYYLKIMGYLIYGDKNYVKMVDHKRLHDI